MPSDAQTLLDLKGRHLLPCLGHFYRNPPVLVRGTGAYLFDRDGRRYLDAYAGVTVMNCGHANPAIVEPAIAQIRALQHTTSIYLAEPMYRLAERLLAFLGPPLARLFFVNSGSEANDGALVLARLHTGRRRFLTLNGGLHGRTALTMAATGIPMWRTVTDLVPDSLRAPRPHCARCELGLRFGSCAFACVERVRALLREQPDTAAMIVEPIQGNGGIVVPPPGYLARLRDVLHEAGALLILDEVQTGFGRTGSRFAFHHEGVAPDIVTLAKALGNGFPIGAFAATGPVAASATRPSASTTGGNPVSAAAALAVLEYMEREDLPGRAARLGEAFHARLVCLAARCPAVAEVRGRGLMLGLELAQDGAPAATLCDQVLEDLKDRGFLVGKTGLGRNVLTVMPPLVVSADDLAALADALDEVLSARAGRHPPGAA